MNLNMRLSLRYLIKNQNNKKEAPLEDSIVKNYCAQYGRRSCSNEEETVRAKKVCKME